LKLEQKNEVVRLFRSIEDRRMGDRSDESPTELHEPTAGVLGDPGGQESPTEVRQPAPGDNVPKHTGRKVGAPLVILGLVAFVAWGLPILYGFHFGCNLLVGDKYREVRLGLEMCRGENQTEANEKKEQAQQEQQAKEHHEAEEKQVEHAKEERERPEREARERKEAQENEENERKIQAENKRTEEENKRTELENRRSLEKEEREEHEQQVKVEAETKRNEEEAERNG
jgi:hypothetical protein